MLLVFCLFYLFFIPQQCHTDSNSDWLNFKKQFNKIYNSDTEEILRKNIFQNSLKFIQEHNTKQKFRNGLNSYAIGINEFSDMTDVEFNEIFLNSEIDVDYNYNNISVANNSHIPLLHKAPDYINWIENGFTNPILNQGKCGSCYTFGAIAAMEAQYFIKTKQLVQLSHQEIMDCSKALGNNGCRGGLTSRTYLYTLENGLGYEYNNPYLAKENVCRKTEPRFNISGFFQIKKGDENYLKEIVSSIGPVAFGFNAGWPSFRYYKNGIYYEPECKDNVLNHAMVIVGYGNENDQDYWLVRNSWGTTWGDQGYIKVVRNYNNHCGIASRALYPIL